MKMINGSMRHLGTGLVALLMVGASSLAARADITVGVLAPLTGPAAALGAETKRAITLIPDTLAGEKVTVVILDDATDPTAAVRAAQRLVSENKVDVILGPGINALAAAVTPVAQESGTPMIALTPYQPPADKQKWVFRSVQNADSMVRRIVQDMTEKKVKTVGYIGFADAWGDLLAKELDKALAGTDIKLVASERFNRQDTTVTAQVLKLLAYHPEVVFVGGSGTPATLPEIELKKRGFKGQIYQSHGVTTREFIRVGGAAVEGTLIPVGPILVAEQLPDGHPSKAAGVAFNKAIEDANGPNSRSAQAGTAWDSWLLFANAVPTALKTAQPGTPEFRAAVRDALENTKGLVGVHGVYTMTPEDHTGLDDNARVLIEIVDGQWKLVK
ncbi:ABC transporter substrate-binding protein [Kaistia dalseonensis]|uniref:Branched-chain amino acid transport system substrate-binding protein n=1 Tax=Kaistia dalseonensis TaxID=410840 RepID=A0ABU0H739_9HYPH|nr:ABC transporter substrate-binding protein [Kaistia dalseonensis]MCX5495532.1 ABC transporter substrate-binding protein [Kaistia dalseonensis]MDQ0438124.1 branched-chain amino acid transport system substrate-binding protein [Kaistia dalseonensis]